MFRITQAALYVFVHFGLMIIIVTESGMDLRQRKMGVLKMDFFGTPPVGDHVQGHLYDLGIRVVNPRNVTIVEMDMGCRRSFHFGKGNLCRLCKQFR